ncbi:conjugative transposon protein TraM [Formosa haliotis]|uniref:conjugative transposon protein TraM n=1 Tax=Formosa haliotis TaxID=1555194 RepID=UPI0008250D55|nr:conjugative transposon protein TraM [Formosa haliotis]
MKIEKNKIVFAGLLLCVLLFIGAYGIILMEEKDEPKLDVNQIPMPELEGDKKQYESKLEAINDLKDVKHTNAPSIYDERYLDSLGVYDTSLLSQKKLKLVDSVYRSSRIYYSEERPSNPSIQQKDLNGNRETIGNTLGSPIEEEISTKSMALEHQLFFASSPISDLSEGAVQYIPVTVDGTQTLKANHRINLRLLQDTKINGQWFGKHTPVYGFVNFMPNRTLINIHNITHIPVKLKAFDWQDGSEGVYIKNSFKGEATTQVIGDIVQDINIAGVPQVSGIKKLFQQNNRSIKVTILDNYRMFLKIDE